MVRESEEYKGHSLFNHIDDNALRTWNRCAVIFNLNKSGNSEGYIEMLDAPSQRQVLAMFQYIKKLGYEKARINVFGKLKGVGGVH